MSVPSAQESVQIASVVVLVPSLSMIFCSFAASHLGVSPEVEATFQNFAAGLVLFAVAGELFPLLSIHPETGEPVADDNRFIGITIGFIAALLLIFGLEWLMDHYTGESEEVSDKSSNEDGDDSDKNATRNKEYYKKVAEAQGLELDENNKIVKDRSQSEDNGSETSPSKRGGRESPSKLSDGGNSALELGSLEDGQSYSNVSTEGDDEVREGADKSHGFVGFHINGQAPDEYDERAIVEASKAISDPNHRAHIREHIQELLDSVKELEEQSIKITDGVSIADNQAKEQLSIKDADLIAEEMDKGIHNLQYLIDHCRRLIQGTEFEFHYDDHAAPTTFNRISEAKKDLMKRRIKILRISAEHVLEHIDEGDAITPSLLKEIYLHMNEMEKHLEFFHDSVEKAANRWTKLHKLPDTVVGDYLPAALIVPVILDCHIDGLLIGVTCSLKQEAGIILALANFVEMGFLGIAYSVRISKCTGSTMLARTVAIYGPPVFMYISALIGALLASATRDTEAVFVGFVAFGVVSYTYLTHELVIEAHEAQGDEQKWYINMWLFIGLWLALIMEPILAAHGE
jgi:zinc transporter ZupT